MAVPEWLAPLSDTALPCIQVVLAGMIVLALAELTKPLRARRAAAPVRAVTRSDGER